MGTAIIVYGAPEFQLARIAVASMGHYYKLPGRISDLFGGKEGGFLNLFGRKAGYVFFWLSKPHRPFLCKITVVDTHFYNHL
ncbi:MAG: hypothetical protein DRP87_17755 [Spirochaetes bacterium]|nr:MAG: hypothetical protein DRP87_17755 [Spirochaetota bacterium]